MPHTAHTHTGALVSHLNTVLAPHAEHEHPGTLTHTSAHAKATHALVAHVIGHLNDLAQHKDLAPHTAAHVKALAQDLHTVYSLPHHEESHHTA